MELKTSLRIVEKEPSRAFCDISTLILIKSMRAHCHSVEEHAISMNFISLISLCSPCTYLRLTK